MAIRLLSQGRDSLLVMRCLPLLVFFLSLTFAHAQYLGFVTYVGVEVDAPVTLPDGSPPGKDVRAQLYRVMDDGTLQALMPATTFQTDATEPRLRYYVKPVNLIVPGITFPDLFADPIEISVRMRAWQGTDWESSRLRGESEDIPVLIKNLLFPPANLVGMKGFTLKDRTRVAPIALSADGVFQVGLTSFAESLSAVKVERSTDLVHWIPFGEFSVVSGITSFTDTAIHDSRAAFFRVRFQ